jgi:DNA-binding NarL/FixJ family response regulator
MSAADRILPKHDLQVRPRNWGFSDRPVPGFSNRSGPGNIDVVQAPKTRVLAVDHNVLLRDGLSLLIQSHADMELVDAVASAKEAVASFTQYRPAVTLMDLDLPDASGIIAIREIRKLDPAACILGLFTHDWENLCNQALQAGARRCLAKDRLNAELAAAIRECAPST